MVIPVGSVAGVEEEMEAAEVVGLIEIYTGEVEALNIQVEVAGGSDRETTRQRHDPSYVYPYSAVAAPLKNWNRPGSRGSAGPGVWSL